MKKLWFLLFIVLIFLPIKSFARDNVDYWYIKNFDSNITVNKDSSLNIDEKITADCGDCVGKHGIFRVLPTVYSPTQAKKVNLYLHLTSITDFNGKPYQFQTTNDRINNTITWQIGDPNVTVQGVNDYEIKYTVANGVRTDNTGFDEFYWNLNGNFWDIETDQFTANIVFPPGVSKQNVKTSRYSGTFGQADAGLADLEWSNDSTIKVSSKRPLLTDQGITLSASFPKGIIVPFQPTFLEKYGAYFSFLIPILFLYLAYTLWKKFGKDPSINPTIAPEFDIPNQLSPMSLGVVLTDGIMKSQYISASIIDLAVKKAIKIEEVAKTGVFSSKDYKLVKLTGKYKITSDEQLLLDQLFDGEDEIMLSGLKNNFYQKIPIISAAVKDDLVKNELLLPFSRAWQICFIVIGVLLFVGAIVCFGLNIILGLSLILSATIVFIFSFLMTKRSLKGAEFNKKILGFKLYMTTAEKYRQRFNEKEGIFERFLPYAIMFGLTELWISKMKQIYGEKYFATYYPYWYIGMMSTFDIDGFSSTISDMSSNMASTITSTPSSSGVGGGGFSGGGGGGGGGGGW